MVGSLAGIVICGTPQANHPSRMPITPISQQVTTQPKPDHQQGWRSAWTGGVNCGTTQPSSHHSRSQEPLGVRGSRGDQSYDSGSVNLRPHWWCCPPTGPVRCPRAPLVGGWLVHWSKIVPQTAEIGLQVDDSWPLNDDVVCLITVIRHALPTGSGLLGMRDPARLASRIWPVTPPRLDFWPTSGVPRGRKL